MWLFTNHQEGTHFSISQPYWSHVTLKIINAELIAEEQNIQSSYSHVTLQKESNIENIAKKYNQITIHMATYAYSIMSPNQEVCECQSSGSGGDDRAPVERRR